MCEIEYESVSHHLEFKRDVTRVAQRSERDKETQVSEGTHRGDQPIEIGCHLRGDLQAVARVADEEGVEGVGV